MTHRVSECVNMKHNLTYPVTGAHPQQNWAVYQTVCTARTLTKLATLPELVRKILGLVLTFVWHYPLTLNNCSVYVTCICNMFGGNIQLTLFLWVCEEVSCFGEVPLENLSRQQLYNKIKKLRGNFSLKCLESVNKNKIERGS